MKKLFNRLQSFSHLGSTQGWRTALGSALSVVEDQYLRLFDRRYHVTTSGYVQLEATSIASQVKGSMHRYRGVNAWALRKFLHRLNPDKRGEFVDLGCGMGRACLIARDFGFAKVIGVELVPEFCTVAQKNVESCPLTKDHPGDVKIVNADAIAYTAGADHTCYFMFRPFSEDILLQVLENIHASAKRRGEPVVVIYSERIAQTNSNSPVFKAVPWLSPRLEYSSWGQQFWAFDVRI